MKKLLTLMAFMLSVSLYGEPKEQITVAAAANVRDALESIKKEYEAANPSTTINIIYGGSGVLVQQILNGARFNLFLSADEQFAQKVVDGGLAVGEVTCYAKGRLVLYSKVVDVTKHGLKSLELESVHRIAVANPVVAPYGAKSVELMKGMGIFEKLKPKIIYGENISATAQYLFTENAQVGFVALSQVKSPTAQMGGYVYLVPSELHSAIVQGCVVVRQKSGNQAAQRFKEYILSPATAPIWEKSGYQSGR